MLTSSSRALTCVSALHAAPPPRAFRRLTARGDAALGSLTWQVLVVQTLDPLYVVGKKLDDASYEVPTDDEIDAVSETIEQLVVEFEDGINEEDDDFEDLEWGA